MKQIVVVLFCALAAVAGGCAGDAQGRLAASRSHLDQQAAALSDASGHLRTARTWLGSQADPRALAQLNGASAQVRRAADLNRQIQADVQSQARQALSLQRHIDAHKNDLLGPRGKRIVFRAILIAIVMAIGWGLVRVGPVFGGPAGTAFVVAGHILSAFAIPLLSWAWTALAWLAKSAFAAIGNLLSPASSAPAAANPVAAPPPAPNPG